MAKSTSVFVCQQCGNEFGKWMGQCSACRAWNSLVEMPVGRTENKRTKGQKDRGPRAEPLKISEVETQEVSRFSSEMEELDRIFGHSVKDGQTTTGIVPGSVVLLTGEPGMGKSTLLTQLMMNLSKEGRGVLYVCGEESPAQIKLRIDRLGGEDSKKQNELSGESNIYLLPETLVENVVEEVGRNKDKYKLVIVDSIQTMVSESLSSFAGSVGQVRECGLQITQALKAANIAGILVGHVTKEGTIAGPKTLEHMVDGVFHLEGERSHDLRIIRALKNRFGTTDEVGVFRMTDKGLMEVRNPGEVFLAERQEGVPGSAVTAVLEGNRVLLLEVQALVLKTNLAMPRRVVNGVKLGRLQMILAVLQKQLRVQLGEMDVFVNVTGGAQIDEPGADLAIALAVWSSLREKPLAKETICIGELGLLGEVRIVVGLEKRVREAKKLGYSQVIGGDQKHIREVTRALEETGGR